MVPSIPRRDGRSGLARCTATHKKETPYADSPLNVLALCLLEGLGIQYAVGGALSAMEANDAK